jgi:hypothetical protein
MEVTKTDLAMQERHLKASTTSQECNLSEPPVLATLHNYLDLTVSFCWVLRTPTTSDAGGGFNFLRRIFIFLKWFQKPNKSEDVQTSQYS